MTKYPCCPHCSDFICEAFGHEEPCIDCDEAGNQQRPIEAPAENLRCPECDAPPEHPHAMDCEVWWAEFRSRDKQAEADLSNNPALTKIRAYVEKVIATHEASQNEDFGWGAYHTAHYILDILDGKS